MDQPQLKGVVIISLPPPDNPSKGKTITTFTFSDPQPHHHHHNHEGDLLPVRSAAPPPTSGRSFLSPKKSLATIAGAALLLVSLWVCLFSEAPIQLLQEPADNGRRREADSFLLPLYPKSGRRVPSAITGVKLGSIGVRGGEELQTRKSSKLTSSAGINSSVVFPLRGNVVPDGHYYTSIFVGSPPRPYYLDVDTGSDLTWIQCDAPCTSCAKGPHPLYKPTKGKIVPPKDSLCLEVQSNENYRSCETCKQCDYEIEYADHSSSMGVLARDEMQLIVANGDPTKLNFVFGCAYDQQGQLLASPAQTDGILGLSSAKVSLPSQLASQGVINNVVGHCISSEADAGGYMFLGDDFVPRWGMTWVPTLSGITNFYSTNVQRISYGSQQLVVGGQGGKAGQVVFDTGSTYTYFPNEAYTNLITYLKSVPNVLVRDDSDHTLPICWRANFPVRSVKDVKQFFEPLTLQFEKRLWIMSTAFTIPPEGYLIISNKGNACLGVLNGSEVHDGSTIVLGDVSLRGKLVVYDNVQQRIGWVRSECAKPQKPRPFPFFL